MEPLKVIEILNAVKGKLLTGNESDSVHGVSIDTRSLQEGDLFFALAGNSDGHRFVRESFLKKASGAVISKNAAVDYPSGALILVENTLKALQELAKYYRKKFDLSVIGITGSNGKTTTKELIKAILSGEKRVYANPGNFNNHLGLPVSLFGIENKHEYCVLEMGANHRGEIKKLAEISQPKIGIITNIGDAHLGNFGSRQAILATKLELLESLPSDGFAVINGDDVFLTRIKKNIPCPYYTFGRGTGLDLRAHSIKVDSEKTNFLLKIGGKDYQVNTPLYGEFNVENILAAATLAWRLNVEIKEIIRTVNNFHNPLQRMNLRTLASGIKVFDDSYNANPKAMRVAINSFIQVFPKDRKFLVLGEMLELGGFSSTEHIALGKFVSTLSVAGIFFYGREMLAAAKAAEKKARFSIAWTENKNELIKMLKDLLQPGDAVFFKGSHALHLEEVIKEIR